jgi:hypothetical protein
MVQPKGTTFIYRKGSGSRRLEKSESDKIVRIGNTTVQFTHVIINCDLSDNMKKGKDSHIFGN